MRLIRLVALAALVLAPFRPAAAQPAPEPSAPVPPVGPQCSIGESTTSFGSWISPGVSLDASLRKSRRIVPSDAPADTVAVRLQMRATTPPGQTWSLVLRDPALRVLAVLDERDFAGQPTATQWTGRLEAAQLSAELVGGGPGLKLEFISGMALPANAAGAQVFSIQGAAPNWEDPYGRSETIYREVAGAVGMLVSGAQTPDATGQLQKRSWCCSGAMLTADIYITNWHCGGTRAIPDEGYWNGDVCASTVVDLGWQEGPVARRQYACTAVLRQNKRLDYALLRVKPIAGPGAATGRAPPVAFTTEVPPDPQNGMFIVHHAQCLPKRVSFAGCRLVSRSHRAWTDPREATSGPDITYRCDTEPGASGAPVFGMSGRMIALHHLGFEGGGPQCPSDNVNKGTMMAAILDDIRAAQPALFAELVPQ